MEKLPGALIQRGVGTDFNKWWAIVQVERGRACRLAAVIKDDGGGRASQMPSWSQIRLEVE